MAELAYPVGHPKHPDFNGKLEETHTPFGYDYEAKHPARGGQGQPLIMERATEDVPWVGHKHLFRLPGNTLAEKQAAYMKLPAEERAERFKWNRDGIPAEFTEGS